MHLPTPTPGHEPDWVATHLADFVDGEVTVSPLKGGQSQADQRLAQLDITGYARSRSEVTPPQRRGATQLSPWIRHGLLSLEQVWAAVADAPTRDRTKFRDELLWQEYARHWYARLGRRTQAGVRRELTAMSAGDAAWPQGMACTDMVLDELHRDGWLVNQTRMWLASHWSVRDGHAWRDGEDHFFRHLLDGSRAANRLGWQWTTGVGSSKPYGFSRWQVEKRSPGLCADCAVAETCPISDWPDDPSQVEVDVPLTLKRPVGDPTVESGPVEPLRQDQPDAVWLTAESLGDDDPALVANPDKPAIFVFDAPLLRRLQLDGKRLVFLAECLSDLATRRPVDVRLGDPIDELAGIAVASTFAPVPGYRRRAEHIGPVEIHPWPWLSRPTGGSVQSFSAWRRAQRL